MSNVRTKTKRLPRYRVPPKRVFRAMGLGVVVDGHIKVVAGFRYHWWAFGDVTPIVVNARVLRIRDAAHRIEGKS